MMSGKRSAEEETECSFSDDKRDPKKPKGSPRRSQPESPPGSQPECLPGSQPESPPVSPTNALVFEQLSVPFCTLERPPPYIDDGLKPAEAKSSGRTFPLETFYPNHNYKGIYTPQILTGFANQAMDKYNEEKQTTYTFEKLEKVLSSASLWYARTFTIIFTAAASDGVVKQRFRSCVATGYDDGTEDKICCSDSDDSYSEPESDYCAINILNVVTIPASPPQ